MHCRLSLSAGVKASGTVGLWHWMMYHWAWEAARLLVRPWIFVVQQLLPFLVGDHRIPSFSKPSLQLPSSHCGFFYFSNYYCISLIFAIAYITARTSFFFHRGATWLLINFTVCGVVEYRGVFLWGHYNLKQNKTKPKTLQLRGKLFSNGFQETRSGPKSNIFETQHYSFWSRSAVVQGQDTVPYLSCCSLMKTDKTSPTLPPGVGGTECFWARL